MLRLTPTPCRNAVDGLLCRAFSDADVRAALASGTALSVVDGSVHRACAQLHERAGVVA